MKRSDHAFEAYSIYAIHLKGTLSAESADWFGGMAVSYDGDGNTTLVGSVIDQAALHGLLDKVRDLGLLLLSVTKLK